jgi:uncharacterized protein YggE
MIDAPTPLVTVRGEAQREVAPDVATFSFSANSAADSAEGVRAELAVASGQIAGLLEQHAAAIERSGTSALYVSPVYSRRGGTRITGYTGSFTTTVVVADFDALSPVVLTLSAVPNGSLNGPWWSLRPDNPAYREVRLDAIADARRRADDYAAAVGGTVADLVEISDLEQAFAAGGGPMRAFALDKGAPEDAGFEFEPVSQTVSGQVTVRYTLSL